MPPVLTDLTYLLSERPIEELKAMLDYFEALPKGRRKSDLVKALASLLSDNPESWLNMLMEGDLKILKRLCDAGPGTSVDLIPTDYPMVVEVLNLAEFGHTDNPDMVSASIYEPIYSLIHNEIDDVISRKEQDGTFKVEHLVMGALETFGIVPLRTFVDSIFGDVEDLSAMKDLARAVSSSPVIRLYRELFRGESYMVSPDVENPEELLKTRRKFYKSVKRYAVIDAASLESCGCNPPFYFYGRDTKEGKELLEMLYKAGYEGEELEYAAHSVWINSQYEPDEKNLDILLQPIKLRDADVVSYEEFVEFAGVIIRYANSIPKWLLKGHSADETGLMVYEMPNGYFEDEFEAFEGPVLDEETLKYFDNANRVRPVPLDDPCPCGSGLSYRFCHGKYFS